MLNNERLQLYHEAIAQRAKEAMQPFHYLAASTDPKMVNEDPNIVPPGDDAILDDWISEHYPEFIAPYIAFKIKDPVYFDPYMFRADVIRNFSAFKWWNYVKTKLNEKKPPMFEQMNAFIEFICKLHSIPGSNAGLERIFSTFSHVWTKLRNKLGPKNVDKLVKIHKALNN